MKPGLKRAHILIIDDEPDMISGFAALLSALGYSSSSASDGKSSLALLSEEEFDLIFCDYLMPDITGLELIKTFKQIAPHTPVIIFTAFGTIERAVSAMQAGAFDFLEKPVDPGKLQIVLEKGLNQRELYKEKNNLIKQLEERYRFDNIVGKSDQMRKIFETIENISDSDANILITGESGTGKELIARCIHARSRRKSKPFVPVNCGAFPEQLFEGELFGYEKGAFTGAVQKKIGLLEYADGGTFFLDEVCEMQTPLQVKLLRVLQDHQLRRLGGNELINVSFRIISATNRHVDEWLEKGLMRRDLYYRLNVIHIDLPPLRERRDDILLLAQHFLDSISNRTNKKVTAFTDEVEAVFETYDWPGNIRELENVIERAVVLTKNNLISINELPSELTAKVSIPWSAKNNPSTLVDMKQQAINNIEKDFLQALLKKHHGNVTRVSEEAGMTRRNVHRLIKLHNIDPDQWRDKV
jgi:DNA-binding NtrC family response regulator